MNILGILSGVLKWAFNPKNRSVVMLIGLVVLILLLLQQCNANKSLKNERAKFEAEATRRINNEEALRDSLKNYKTESGTLIGERQGLLLKAEELENEYADLLSGFNKLKKEKVRTVVKTEYIIKERVDSVTVFASDIDSTGNGNLSFNDSARFDDANYRVLSGNIPVKLFQIDSSRWRINPGLGSFKLEQGMGLRTGLYLDTKTNKIAIRVETDYPGVTFTNIEGANVMDDPESKKVTRQFRKPWSFGFTVGYNMTVDTKTSGFNTGPGISVGLQYHPKWLQWGK